jgi:hypothetical protein
MSAKYYNPHNFARRHKIPTNRLLRAAVHLAAAAFLIEDENFAAPGTNIHLAKFVELLRHVNRELRDLASSSRGGARRPPELREC